MHLTTPFLKEHNQQINENELPLKEKPVFFNEHNNELMQLDSYKQQPIVQEENAKEYLTTPSPTRRSLKTPTPNIVIHSPHVSKLNQNTPIVSFKKIKIA